jgi:hypothetical protein
VSGSVISSSTFNALTSDLATELTDSLSRSGKGAASANLSMGNNKLTSLANGAVSTDAVNLGQTQTLINSAIQGGAATYLTSVSGTNTVTASATPTLTAYAAGQVFTLVPAAANTGATTININSVGAKNVFAYGIACKGGELVAGVPATVVYDGTQFQLVNPQRPRSGTLVQRVEGTPYTTYSSTTSDMPLDDTIPQNTEGTEYLAATVTPTKSANRLVIEAILTVGADTARNAVGALFQDSTANALTAAAVQVPSGTAVMELVLRHEMAAGTTSATTFKVRLGRGGGAGSITVNGTAAARVFGGVSQCRISVAEIEG